MGSPFKIYYQCHELTYDANTDTWQDTDTWHDKANAFTARRSKGLIVIKDVQRGVVDLPHQIPANFVSAYSAAVVGTTNVVYFNQTKRLQDYLTVMCPTRNSRPLDNVSAPGEDYDQAIESYLKTIETETNQDNKIELLKKLVVLARKKLLSNLKFELDNIHYKIKGGTGIIVGFPSAFDYETVIKTASEEIKKLLKTRNKQ